MNTANHSLRILIADDNALVRGGMRLVLQDRPGWVVCGEAADGRDAIEKAAQLNPDVILVDVSMPDLNGFEVAGRICQQLPQTKILIVTEHDASSLAYAGPQPGVRGYVMKSHLASDLLPAIEAALRAPPPPPPCA